MATERPFCPWSADHRNMPHLRADETVACALRDSDAGVLTLAEWQRDIVEELRSSADGSAPTAPE